MPTIDWGASTSPEVTLWKKFGAGNYDISWGSPLIWQVGAAESVRLRLRFRGDARGVNGMRAWVHLLDYENNVVEQLAYFDEWPSEGADFTRQVTVPITAQITRIRIRARVLESMSMASGYSDEERMRWEPEESRIFTAYVAVTGRFALDFVPVTLLYCPPEQDMTNALSQSTTYGTIVTRA